MVPGVAWLDPEFLKGFFHNQDNGFFLYVCTIPGTSSTTVALPGTWYYGYIVLVEFLGGSRQGREGRGGLKLSTVVALSSTIDS